MVNGARDGGGGRGHCVAEAVLEGLGRSGKMSLSQLEIEETLIRGRELLMRQPSMLELRGPVTVCGDIHGQAADLLRLFALAGYPPKTNYLFLGDYVDRGPQSLEVIVLLLGLKLRFPEKLFLLRGNHESPSINRAYGFYDECVRRYSARLWRSFQTLFEALPLTAVVGGRILCMHGGLSPRLRSRAQLAGLTRPLPDIPRQGLLTDLLWADPAPDLRDSFRPSPRGVSFQFGPDVVRRICGLLDIDLVARAHQVVQDGYEFFAGRRLVTIFSAPHYCGEFDNAGAVMSVAEDLHCSFHIFRPVFESRAQPAAGQLLSQRVPVGATAPALVSVPRQPASQRSVAQPRPPSSPSPAPRPHTPTSPSQQRNAPR